MENVTKYFLPALGAALGVGSIVKGVVLYRAMLLMQKRRQEFNSVLGEGRGFSKPENSTSVM